LTTSRLEAGALQIRTERVEVLPLLMDVASSTEPDRAPEVTVECPDDLIVMADADRLHQVVANYVSNALRYGRPPVSIRAVASNASVEITVRDEGPTITGDLRANLFEKFPNERDRRGTGLGLFIVKELARAQRGEAWHASGGETGNVFGIRVPAAVGPHTAVKRVAVVAQPA
jgi:signal transduction histidine kinase